MSAESDQGAGTVREGAQIEEGQEIRVGDKVEYHVANTTTMGTVKEILTETGEMGGRNVKATEDEPRFVVENENTGKESAIYKKAIERVIEGDEQGSSSASAQKSNKKGGSKKGKKGGQKVSQQQEEGGQEEMGEEEEEEEEEEGEE